MRRKSVRRKAIRISLLVSNVVVLAAIAAFVLLQNPQKDATTSAASVLNNSAESEAASNPLDQVSSADIALTVARMGQLPETTAVSNQAQSQAADTAIATSNDSVVSMPQVISTALKSSADITDYTTVAGDTVSSLATKFGVTSDSIRWSNNITGDALTPGTQLRIPPINGIVYTVNTGDTVDSIAAKFHASKEKITAYNDAEIKGLTVGQRIIVPDGIQTTSASSLRETTGPGLTASSFAWGSLPVYGGNGYDYGYCTWYVANRISVPNNWGNANTWAYYAPASGWQVSKSPRPGSIAQSTAGVWGHVAIVEAVSDDGTMIKYSDMNGLSGWGRVGTTANWVPASKFNNYIYR